MSNFFLENFFGLWYFGCQANFSSPGAAFLP
jgi:hypothetical protein